MNQKDLEKVNQRASSRYRKAQELDKVRDHLQKELGVPKLSENPENVEE